MRYTKLVCFLLFCLQSAVSTAGYTEWIDFDSSYGLIRVPVQVEGIDTHAIFDTGATLNAISNDFIERHQLDLTQRAVAELKGVFRSEEQALYDDVNINLLGFQAEVDGVASMNLPDRSGGILIGAGFFQQFIVQIDYPNSRLRLISRDSLDLKELQNIEMLPQRDSGQPLVRIKLNDDRSAWMLLDTGSGGGVSVKRQLAETLGWLEQGKWVDKSSHGANSAGNIQISRLERFNFGPFELADVLVSVPAVGQTTLVGAHEPTEAGSRIRSQRIEGIIGYDVLKHFVLTIDYKYGHAHIGAPEA
ncbi:pepsin/retropepsin-like aspartic protease family protein [Bacterioplanes sanyensis]|uniref:pepsin/retropepsin-like aspartic protease family protein n=1 Tax=Bacterioplanes sanyensis TaxID=1249553 RepID=UPI0012FD159E|nr:pepsin/retropepsin-like aspartic protease family protein [Bacterioplanes sanyensis]